MIVFRLILVMIGGGENTTNRVCLGNLCIKYDNKNWTEASNICSLASITTSNERDVQQLINPIFINMFPYWIGLRRSRQWVWLDGSGVNVNIPSEHESRECLTVTTDWSSSIYSPESCSKMLPAICVQFEDSDAKKNSHTKHDDSSMGIAVAAGITAVVICVILLTWVQRAKCKKMSRSKYDDTPPGYYCHFGNRLDKDIEIAASTTTCNKTTDSGVSKFTEGGDCLDSEQSQKLNDYFVVENFAAASACGSGSGSPDHLYCTDYEENDGVEIQLNSHNDFGISDNDSFLNSYPPQNVDNSRQIEIYAEVHKPKWRTLADNNVACYSHLNASDCKEVEFYDTADNSVPSKPIHCETYSRLRDIVDEDAVYDNAIVIDD